MLRLPVLAPPAVGLKVTEMVQLAPPLRVVPQVLVSEKSPLAAMLEMVSEALPVLARVTVWALLLVPDIWAWKVSEVGDKVTTACAATTVRLKVLVTELTPLPLAVMVIVWLLTSVALLAACRLMLPELPVPGCVMVAVTPLGKVLVASVTLPV
jgi:hypothetical protein